MKLIESKTNNITVLNFIKKTFSPAIKCEEKYGILAEVLISQSALETGWGQFVLKGLNPFTNKIECSNNYFNIKTGSQWNGEYIIKNVKEYEKNKNNSDYIEKIVKDSFRKYNNIEESFEDYCILISTLKRYEEAYKNRYDIEKYLDGLIKGGYATDPKYKEKIFKILNKYIKVSFISEDKLVN